MSWPSILFILILVITERVVYTQHCYACSNINSSKMLAKLEDKNWRNWLSNANKFPHGLTDNCLDEFVPEIAIRSGARSTNCPNGTCLKLSINEHRGESYIWRSCIANSAKEIRTDCTKINTNQG
ncbi:hypothetical protein M3Y94_00291800 [Aphelenchoides besseyi]|nr:hypothetical protein M3Y94_00291800 [Aphelenchoides besseyi]